MTTTVISTEENHLKTNELASPAERRWPWLINLFRWYAKRFVARHFHAFRLARAGSSPEIPDGPVIVALNHPSWWDPMTGLVLSELFGDRIQVAPIDATALGQYRFFERLGFFGIEPGTSRGYRQLLAVADQVMARQDIAFWITPQGKFTDPRVRPAELRTGIGHIATKVRHGSVLPIAVEYPFWTERLPEALVKFGKPLVIKDGSSHSPEEWTEQIEAHLIDAQDHLAELSMLRDEKAFITLLKGRSGVAWVYDAFRTIKAWLKGQRFEPEHGAVVQNRQVREESKTC